ncbi:MAG TPA: glycosyltransferase family 39 protein [Pyrinomonadaceae bacterium]|nr:glycosyltransferase family 39 protein [Pyrinomonadaceae bacterium]
MPFPLRFSPLAQRRVLFFFLVFLVAASIRLLTFNFLRANLNDPGWFQSGSYRVFDKRANDILDGKGKLFWIDDPSRTDLVQYPPAYPWMVAAIYRATGQRSAYAVQSVQAVLDFIISMVLITGLAVTAYGWPTGLAANVLVALSPLLAIVGVAPSADAPTTWFVFSGLWLFVIAAKRSSVSLAFLSGLILGVGCWLRVNPLYLCLFWAVPLFLFGRNNRWMRVKMATAVVIGTVLMILPIVIRNYVVFPDFTPTGGTIGANLWEGLGETELGRSNGFALGDEVMVERERVKLGVPADAPFEQMWPDGIKRERERTRESLAFIRQHPVWYAGVVLHRMWGMLKIAGAPLPYYGTSGINVTSRKCLSPARQGGVTAAVVNVLGMLQSVTRYALVPLAAFGCWFAVRKDWAITSLLLATIFYYLVPGSFAHTEIRYVLTLHWILPIFAGLSVVTLGQFVRSRLFVSR